MEKKSLRNTGVGRRGFLSGSSLLLTGALLALRKKWKQRKSRLGSRHPRLPRTRTVCSRSCGCQSHFGRSRRSGRIRARQCAASHQPGSFLHLALAGARPGHGKRHRGIGPGLRSGDGNKRRLYSERFIHSEIYKVRPDVKSVVHTHAPTVVLMEFAESHWFPSTT